MPGWGLGSARRRAGVNASVCLAAFSGGFQVPLSDVNDVGIAVNWVQIVPPPVMIFRRRLKP